MAPKPSEELLKKHYADLSARPFFNGLVKYMSSGPVVPMVWEGLNVVKTGRVMLGATDPKDSAPGTIRGDLCIQMPEDVQMADTPMGDAGEVETFAFQAEIAQLMSLIINTFYSNKEIFLRELISNSSDALDKIRYESLMDPSKLDSGKDLYIKIIPNKNDRTLTIIDTGIGMTKSDLVNNLGTIAKSGTKTFMEALQAGADISMIGQFGVGFYSAYLVADRVTVSSKHNDDEQYLWESSAGGSFTIRTDPGEPLGRGTKITLYIKEDQAEFLEEKKIKEIVKKHSQFIGYPIKLLVEKERDKELSDDEEEEEKDKDKVEESPCCIVTSQYGWTANMERIMKAQALRDTSTMGYMAAKKHLEINPEHPVMETLRQKAEADKHDKAVKDLVMLLFETALLSSGFALEEPQVHAARIYRMIKLGLGIDEEDTQPMEEDKVDEEMPPLEGGEEDASRMEEMPEDVKMQDAGEVETFAFQAEIAQLMSLIINTFYSNKEIFLRELISNSSDSLTDPSKLDNGKDLYIKLIPNKNDRTLTIIDTGIGMTKSDLVNNLGTIAKSGTKAFMEALQAGADISMIGQFGVGFYSAYLVADRVTVSSKHNDDEQYLWESSAGGSFTIRTDPGEPLGRGTKITLYIKEDQAEFLEEKKIKEIVKKHSQFIGYPIKLLVEKERDKELSDDEEEEEKDKDKVEESPCCIVTSQYGWTANMERIMKAQALRDTSTMGYMAAKKHLEINPEHPVMETLRQKAEADKHDKAVKDLVMLLFETALLSSGFALEEPQVHAARIYRMIKLGLGIDEEEDISMIGQFGVGFYSAYLVADRVTVSSKHNDDEQYLWESSAGGSFTIRTDPGEPLGRGTKITLYIKEDQAEFLEEKKIKEIVKKHSQFIGYPIKLLVEKERDKELSDDEEEEEKDKDKVEESPCCIVTSQYGWTANMERIMKAQALRDTSTMGYMAAKKHLEINPEHPVMETLRQKAEADKHDKAVKDLVMLLFETALLSSGFALEEPQVHAARIYRMIKLGLGIDEEDPHLVEEEKVDEEMPPLEGEGEDASRMEEVD
uniref:Heat shock protein 83 n=1 Tax=Timema genevievae TaxID=629358 RepID=A0A7R9PQG0_TIMGE|nr:unnamed protein product [Timema genevievae]